MSSTHRENEPIFIIFNFYDKISVWRRKENRVSLYNLLGTGSPLLYTLRKCCASSLRPKRQGRGFSSRWKRMEGDQARVLSPSEQKFHGLCGETSLLFKEGWCCLIHSHTTFRRFYYKKKKSFYAFIVQLAMLRVRIQEMLLKLKLKLQHAYFLTERWRWLKFK